MTHPRISNTAGTLYVEAQGTGPVVVLAHGFGGSARNFLPQVRDLKAAHRLWLYDARGHSRSAQVAVDGGFGWSELVDDFDSVVRRAVAETDNSPKRPLVVGGLSMGAVTALLWALRHPDELDGLILAAYPATTVSQKNWALDFADAIDRLGIEGAAEQFVWGARGAFKQSDAATIRRGFAEHAPQALAGILRSALANVPDIVSVATDLAQLDIPSLVVVGGDDERSLDASKSLAECLRPSRLAIIEQAGHVVNLARPGEFNREIRQYLASLSDAGTTKLK